jgi:DNA-binding MarR family transcriptional regulator
MIGALLRKPTDAMRERLLAGLSAKGFTDFAPSYFAVMRFPGPHGRRPTELADETGMTRQAMNYLLGQLEGLGYLVREADPADAHAKRIRLTPRGETLWTTIRTIMGEIEQDLRRQLGQRRFDQLRDLLVDLNACTLATDQSIQGRAVDRGEARR